MTTAIHDVSPREYETLASDAAAWSGYRVFGISNPVACSTWRWGAEVVISGAGEHRVLEDEPSRLEQPQRHAQLLALRDREVDFLHARPSFSLSRASL
jgi:hypothetical protein